jgi:glycerol-3-phosphate acyltransferase PlsY
LFKGVVAVVAARVIVTNLLDITFFNDTIFIGYIAGLFVMLGHIFPVYYGFHGGKGVLLAATTLIAMDPLTCLLSVTVFAIVLAVSKYVSLGSICAATAYPVFTIITQTVRGTDGRLENFLVTLLIGALIIYMHKPNIQRLRTGTENKFGQKKKNPVENDAPESNN